ncbi:alpha-2-macroglobulin [Geothrix sp. PMB-07]|uniref:alpha-2-macroglobulin family protein n=1 Tax=Geothrix sp. PMB-07 TaxID=3068640 RepID=UPI0027411877|nr:MG2 domain-containing protein [Geothrix sp. PMB-07]WLT30134.1 MG2 domain-containing protein [Geothrix sp. PMB-07]
MRWFRPLLTLLMPALLLLPTMGTAQKRSADGPWREGGWTGAFATLRPTLPGKPGQLEAAGPIPSEARIRIYRVEDPDAFLKKVLVDRGAAAAEGGRGVQDPLDVLREAVLWGGRRAFVTVHRTASQSLRDAAKQTDRLTSAKTSPAHVREGSALPLEGQPGITFVTEIVPKVAEDIAGKKGHEDDESGEEGFLSRVELPAQAAGLYLVEVLRGSDAAYVPWMVSDLALLSEQDGARLRVQAVDGRDGAPKGGGTILGQIFEGAKAQPISFDGAGKAEVAVTPGVRRIVVARSGASLAILASEGQSAASVRQRLYAFTERPLYRPGQEVFAKAILRRVDDGENRVVSGAANLAFTVLDPEDTKVTEGQAKLLNAETGTYGAQFNLPGAGRLGLYRIVFQGPQGPGQAEFKVEQFVKPAFEVKVTTEKSKVGLGDELNFHAAARYFYGAAVRGAKADWFLYKVVPPKSKWIWDDEDAGPAPELMESGQVDLDDEGQVDLPSFKAESDGLWRMVVKVADAAGQRNSGQAQVRAAAGDLVLMIAADRQVALPGKPFQVTARALDLDGKEVPGVAITLRAARIIALKDNAYWWSRPSALKPGETVASAPGPQAMLSIPEGGAFLLVAEAKDSKGRPVVAQRQMTVAAEGTPLPAVPDLRAAADKPEYQPGDTARILVQLPRPKLTLHWAIEHEGLGQRQSRAVLGTTALVDIPITAAMQPNVWAVFEIVAEGRRQMVEVPLRVPKRDRRLQVAVTTDKDRYQPGQPMKVSVAVTDAAGKPSAADLSVGVVDEAIYALSQELHPDPVRFFHPTRRHGVLRSGSTDWSFHDLLRRQRPVWSLKQTKRGDFKADDDDKVRQNFKDTAHWAPFVAAGRDGKASVDLVLPDNLTAWRATATAVTSDTKVGVGRSSKPSSKPLQVALTLPRTLSVGEEARAIALVRNLSGQPIQGKIRLEVQNGRFSGTPEGSFSLQDQGEYRLALPLFSDKTGPLTVTARVEGGGLKDAERQKVTVQDQLVPASLSGSVVLDGSAQTFTVPAPPAAKGEATLVLTPVGNLEHLAAPSLPYLIGYPYGCVEQTLSSFVPNLLVADLVKQGAMPDLDWKKLTDLDRNIRDGVFKVYGYQQPNGGWGWYAPNDFGLDANPHTTGYAIQSFATMKRLGYAVDEGVYRRGRQAALSLFQQVARQADSATPAQRQRSTHGQSADPQADAAFLLVSLAQTGEPIAGLLDSAADKVLNGKWTGAHVHAMTALAAATAKHPKAAALVAALEQKAVVKGGLARWEGRREDWWSYASGDVVPTVMALKALSLARPQSPLIRQGETFLASEYRGYGWYSTWSTGQIVDLLPYLMKTRKLDWGPLAIQAAVQGGPSFEFKERPETRRWNAREPRAGSYPMAEPKPVTVTASGRGLLVWTYAYQVPGSAAGVPKGDASSALRLSVTRNLWRLKTPQETGNARQGWVRQPWTGTMKAGEEAWMQVQFRTDRDADYVMLEVPIPGGLNPTVKLEGFVLEGKPFTDEGSSDAWMKPRIEVHPDKVTFLFNRTYSWSTQSVRIHLRAGMAGSYRLRPAKLSLMSNEGQWATCDGLDLKVVDGGAR